jgi:hypothetical protein
MPSENQSKNLAAGMAAIAAVKAMLPLGAGNRAEDREEIYNKVKRVAGKDYPSGPLLLEAGARLVSFIPEVLVTAMRVEDHLRQTRVGELIWGTPQPWVGVSRVRDVAAQAKRYRTGNCSDQACVAFVDLYDRGVLPLDIMFLTNNMHAFVTIGKDAEGNEDPATWGDEVIICDPWNHEAYHLPPDSANSLLLIKMKCNCSQAKSQFRQE